MAEYNPACQFDTADVGFDVGAFDKTLLIDSESFSAIDAVASSGVKGLTEVLNITDGMYVKLRLSQALQIIDSFTESVIKLASESFSVSDTIIKSGTKLLNESLNIVDTFAKSVSKLLSESFSIGDIVKFKVFLDETLQVGDALVKSGIRILSESLLFIDTVRLIEEIKEYMSFSEGLHITDSIVLTSALKVNETIKIVDLLFRKIFMIIRKITIRVRGGSYESDIELEEKKEE